MPPRRALARRGYAPRLLRRGVRRFRARVWACRPLPPKPVGAPHAATTAG
ncbi:MAG: hypothetical protein JO364_04790 [Pseudonocardiales bacterium]|nr:hypothetical protein [Pseudonocardiales bacterium]